MVGKRRLESDGDGSELLFGQGGLDGGPGVPDGCWWVVRIAEKKCLMNICTCWHVDVRVPVELLLPFRFGHVASAGADCRDESCVRMSAQVEHGVCACSFELSTGLGFPW